MSGLRDSSGFYKPGITVLFSYLMLRKWQVNNNTAREPRYVFNPLYHLASKFEN